MLNGRRGLGLVVEVLALAAAQGSQGEARSTQAVEPVQPTQAVDRTFASDSVTVKSSRYAVLPALGLLTVDVERAVHRTTIDYQTERIRDLAPAPLATSDLLRNYGYWQSLLTARSTNGTFERHDAGTG